MREIKFRAWHTKQEKMFSAEEMGEDQLTLSVDGRGFVNVHSASTQLSEFAGDKMIPMQFTGLIDKNGKEIYENDIIKLEHWQPKIYEVVFDRGGFCFRDGEDANFYNDCKYLEDCEVIGNIYENSDLLQSSKGDIM